MLRFISRKLENQITCCKFVINTSEKTIKISINSIIFLILFVTFLYIKNIKLKNDQNASNNKEDLKESINLL